MNKYFAEFIGTFLLVSVILNFPSENPIFGLAVGLTLAVAIFMAGKYSGGHFNPAVSIAKYINGDISSTDVILYPLSQIIGGLVAYLLHTGGRGIVKGDEPVAQPVVLSDSVLSSPEPTEAPSQPEPQAPVVTEPPVASETPVAQEAPEVNTGEQTQPSVPQINEMEPQGLDNKSGGYGMTLIDDLDNQPIFG